MKHRKIATLIYAIAMLLLSSACCESKEYRDTKANIRFELKDNWTVTSNTPLTLVSPGGETVLVFEVVKASTLENALVDAEVFLGKNLSNITMTPRKDIMINGIPASEVEGSCSMNGIPAAYKLLVLAGASDWYTYLYYFGAAGHETINKEAIQNFLGSIKKIRQR